MKSVFGLLFLCAACSPQAVIPHNPEAKVGSTKAEKTILAQWGQRPDTCLEAKDWTNLSFPSKSQAQNFLDGGKRLGLHLKTQAQNCYRVGNEVLLFEDPSQTQIIARGIVTKIEINDTESRIIFDALERYKAMTLTAHGDRIPNCDNRYVDWQSFYLPQGDIKKHLEQLQSGQTTASLWNGAYNCFRIGTEVKVTRKGEDDNNLGTVIVKELRLLRYVDLDDETLTLSGQEPSVLKTHLEKELSRDGGLVSVMIFEYLPPDQAHLGSDNPRDRPPVKLED